MDRYECARFQLYVFWKGIFVILDSEKEGISQGWVGDRMYCHCLVGRMLAFNSRPKNDTYHSDNTLEGDFRRLLVNSLMNLKILVAISNCYVFTEADSNPVFFGHL